MTDRLASAHLGKRLSSAPIRESFGECRSGGWSDHPQGFGSNQLGFVMHKGARLLGAILAAAALGIISGPATAQSSTTGPDLGGTSWTATNAACDVDGIDFRSDGTADVYDDTNGDQTTAHWTLDGDALHLKYDDWYGGIEGSIFDGTRIEAVETWRSKETQTINTEACIFEKK